MLSIIQRYTFIIILFVSIIDFVNATHNRAGEISFEQIGPLTIRATLTTYTKTSSIAADRDSVVIFWGDGTSEFAVRANGWGDPQPNDVKINYYIATHTYPARATYSISMYDPNRVGGILNVNYPDSESVPFFLQTTFTFLNTQFQGENNSAVLLQAPIDFGCVGEVFTHNPNAYDVDGDSLHYRLIIPLQGPQTVVPDYNYPDQIGSSTDNKLTLDEFTGNLVWDSPKLPGEYNIAIMVEEYRQGVLINSMIRDMQIFIVDECENKPPELEIIDELCVYAGDQVEVSILVDDQNPTQLVRLEASGAPFISTENVAELVEGDEFKEAAFEATFRWKTSCEDISDQYYQIIFKAMDNGFSDTSGLATLKILRVKVTGPPPDSLRTEISGDHHLLKWSYPYVCAFAEEEFFRGFSIWRSRSSISLTQDSCDNGLEGTGYEIISFIHNLDNGIDFYYEDLDVEAGETYCYRVVPEFAHISFDGFPYNQVSGQAGNESCIAVPLHLPYLTLADIRKTGESDGQTRLRWKLYDKENFNSDDFPPPYELRLSWSTDQQNYSEIPGAVFTFDDLNMGLDSVYDHYALNTLERQQHYLLDLYYSTDKLFLGSSLDASTLFLDTDFGDESVRLSYSAEVPWVNQLYEVYRKDPGADDYQLIAETTQNFYTDDNVSNGNEYCYKVASKGNYLFDPANIILNYSQELCVIPRDQEAPCAPNLEILSDCDTASLSLPEELIFNHLKWDFEEGDCQEIKDIYEYHVYYSPDSTGEYERIFTLGAEEQKSLDHNAQTGTAGCYYVTAIDSSLNESLRSNIVCMENCPLYELPNVFTPNDDGIHDIYTARYIRHIYEVDMKIFNQWGQLVFQSNDPAINWDGRNKNGEALAEGVYHYSCRLNLPGDELRSGYIHLIRGNN